MKPAADFVLVLVTAPDKKTARRIAKAALKKKFAACANLVPGLESHYWWKGEIESAAEVLILFKTIRTQVSPLEQLVLAMHPYDTPEFLVVPVLAGHERYLRWLAQAIKT